MARRRQRSGRSYATTKRPGNIHQNTATSTATSKPLPIADQPKPIKHAIGWVELEAGALEQWRASPIWNEGGKQK
jgi:hypothetical protein